MKSKSQKMWKSPTLVAEPSNTLPSPPSKERSRLADPDLRPDLADPLPRPLDPDNPPSSWGGGGGAA
jgi:hypothetical protein